jgi:hypothetical protein
MNEDRHILLEQLRKGMDSYTTAELCCWLDHVIDNLHSDIYDDVVKMLREEINRRRKQAEALAYIP